MSYITTVTGIHFYPLNPNPKDIDIEDIAHALSLICRPTDILNTFTPSRSIVSPVPRKRLSAGYPWK